MECKSSEKLGVGFCLFRFLTMISHSTKLQAPCSPLRVVPILLPLPLYSTSFGRLFEFGILFVSFPVVPLLPAVWIQFIRNFGTFHGVDIIMGRSL